MPKPAAPRDDAALEVLFHPFDTGALAWPRAGGALFLRARDGWPLHAASRTGLVCEQTFKPAFDAMQRSGLDVRSDAAEGTFPLVLVLPPRQRDEARALFARALDHAGPDGIVVACMPNDEGAKTGQGDLATLAGPVSVLSKQHCRVFWTGRRDEGDAALADAWRSLDAPRVVADGRFTSRPGVFAWDRVDAASALLARHFPDDLAGRGADLGAGVGYLAIEALTRSPRIAALDLFEAEARALDLARTNLAHDARARFHWHDVCEGIPSGYDFIVTNPPFHAQGRAERPDLGKRFIEVAADALAPEGRLYLVANRHLPYEVVLDKRFAQVRTLAVGGGFKVVEARRA